MSYDLNLITVISSILARSNNKLFLLKKKYQNPDNTEINK